jgi:hypothetical protein
MSDESEENHQLRTVVVMRCQLLAGLVNAVINLQVPQKVRSFLTS